MRKIENNIKYIVILLRLLCMGTVAEAQDFLCVDGQGKSISLDSYLYPNEIYHFSKCDGQNANWRMFLIGRWDNIKEVKQEKNVQSISTDIEDTSFNWSDIKQFKNATIDTCYFKCLITSERNGKEDSIYVKLSYTPGKPIIENVSLTYDGYDYDYHTLNNATFSCKLYIPHAETVDVVSYVSDNKHYFGGDYFIFDERLALKPTDGYFNIQNYWCDEDREVYFYGHNKYGWSISSDTIIIENLINDSIILDDLKKFAEQFVGISAPTIGLEDIININPNEITIKTNSCQNIYIYDLQGRLALCLKKPAYGYKAYLKNGIYIIKILIKNNCITKKIVL